MERDPESVERIARRLSTQADRLAAIYDRELTRWVAPDVWQTPMLGGVVASLLRALALEIESDHPDPGAVWAHASGILRLAPSRGVEAVTAEADSLRHLLRAIVGPPRDRTEVEIRAFCDAVADAVEAGMLEELARLHARATFRLPRFGGIVVELFEAPARRVGHELETLH